MFARFSRSLELIKASGTILRQDKELLLFPLCAAIATALVAASFLVPLFLGGEFERLEGEAPDAAFGVLLFLFYLLQYFIIFFFNSALVGAAMIRLDGGDPTLADGFRIASSRIVQILGYAAIAATVGLILRLIEERAGFIGRWIAGLLGLAFTVATFLAVPILVSRDVGPLDAVKESAALLKKTWGENVIGTAGMGLVFFLIYLCVCGIGMVFVFAAAQTGSAAAVILVCAILVLTFIAVALVQTALQGVYSAALYRYATGGNVGAAFSATLLADAFKPKR
jgi:hypothetical protein